MSRRLPLVGDLVVLSDDSGEIYLRTGTGSVVPHRRVVHGETMLVIRRWTEDLTVLDAWHGDVEVLTTAGRRGWVLESRLRRA